VIENRRDAFGAVSGPAPKGDYSQHLIDGVACRCAGCGNVRFLTNVGQVGPFWRCLECRRRECAA
jgi:hypothetical protein